MKAIIFSPYFLPPDELIKFCDSIGYGDTEYYSDNFDLMFDSRVIDFCEQRLSNLWEEEVYKGRPSKDFMVGFAGAGYIREIDTTRSWKIRYTNVGSPMIDYINICKNKYGYTSIKSSIPVT